MGTRWRGREMRNHTRLFAYCHQVGVGPRATTQNEEDGMREGGGERLKVLNTVKREPAEGLQSRLTYGFERNKSKSDGFSAAKIWRLAASIAGVLIKGSEGGIVKVEPVKGSTWSHLEWTKRESMSLSLVSFYDTWMKAGIHTKSSNGQPLCHGLCIWDGKRPMTEL